MTIFTNWFIVPLRERSLLRSFAFFKAPTGSNGFSPDSSMSPGNVQYGIARLQVEGAPLAGEVRGFDRGSPAPRGREEFEMAFSGLQEVMFRDQKSVDWFEPLPGEKIGMRVESAHTGNAFSLTEIIVAPQIGPPLHIHHDADEVLFVLEGTVDFVCNGKRFRTGAGGLAAIPKGSPHAFRNFEDTPARMIVLLSPGGFEQVMHAMMGRSLSEFPAIAAKYHLEIVGPPIPPVDD
jgi:mannose-6-phosphate isomerase-like protein (cupin superfamily)